MKRASTLALLLAMLAVIPSAAASEGALIADSPTIDYKGDPPYQMFNEFWFRCDSAAAIFTFGCVNRMSSISSGYAFIPPTLNICFFRSLMNV